MTLAETIQSLVNDNYTVEFRPSPIPRAIDVILSRDGESHSAGFSAEGWQLCSPETVLQELKSGLQNRVRTPHPFKGRSDRWCYVCGLPDRHPIHKAQLT